MGAAAEDLPSAEDVHTIMSGWRQIAADPSAFLRLGIASPRWVSGCVQVLRDAADAASYRGSAFLHVECAAAGYVLAWGAFSVLATAAQWALSAAMLLSAMMTSKSPVFAASLLVIAGVYQFTPLKIACLSQCRSPAEFLIRHRRPGPLGPLLMGLQHGYQCIACCWALMALLFAFGVMNLLWVAALAVFVFIEKLAPAGPLIGRVGGFLMICAGLVMMAIA